MLHLRNVALVGLLVGSAVSGFWASAARAASKCTSSTWAGYSYVDGKVDRTVDGDTFHVAIGSKTYAVRMLSIDTPETHFNGMSQGYWGERAADRLRTLLPTSAPVRIYFGNQSCDSYGRILGFAYRFSGYPANPSQGFDVNAQMVYEGLAYTYCLAPNLTNCQTYSNYSRSARSRRAGVFSVSGLETPYEWRHRLQGRPDSGYVGSVYTHHVIAPKRIAEVPVTDRVFFNRYSDIQSPYFYSSTIER